MFVNKIYFNDIVNAKLTCIINTYISLSMSNGKLLKKKKHLQTLTNIVLLQCFGYCSYM